MSTIIRCSKCGERNPDVRHACPKSVDHKHKIVTYSDGPSRWGRA